MVFIYTTIISSTYIALLFHNQQFYIYLTTLLLSFLYYWKLFTTNNISFTNKLKNGQLLHQISYLFWMAFFSQQEFMYFVPFVLSNVGKIYSLFHQKDEENYVIIEELIKFQVKLQFYLTFILLSKLIHPSLPHLFELLTFILLCKIKYTFYFPAQKAYVELHFFFDNIMKKCGKRKIYHYVHNVISYLGGVSNTSREIAY